MSEYHDDPSDPRKPNSWFGAFSRWLKESLVLALICDMLMAVPVAAGECYMWGRIGGHKFVETRYDAMTPDDGLLIWFIVGALIINAWIISGFILKVRKFAKTPGHPVLKAIFVWVVMAAAFVFSVWTVHAFALLEA